MGFPNTKQRADLAAEMLFSRAHTKGSRVTGRQSAHNWPLRYSVVTQALITVYHEEFIKAWLLDSVARSSVILRDVELALILDGRALRPFFYLATYEKPFSLGHRLR